MGLDIYGYKQVTRVDVGHFDADGEPITISGEPIEYDRKVYVNPDFPGREEGVVDRAYYQAEACFADVSMPYSRYNRLRNELAELAGYPEGFYEQYGKEWPSHCVSCWDGEQGPFSELINFSDCEGTIGPVVSKKLAADFEQFQGKANAHADEEFRIFYNGMRQTFEYAAQDGFVIFS